MIEGNPFPLVTRAGLITVSRLVDLLLRTVLLMLILRMWLLIVVMLLILLTVSENGCYMSHLVLVTGETHSLPLHRGSSLYDITRWLSGQVFPLYFSKSGTLNLIGILTFGTRHSSAADLPKRSFPLRVLSSLRSSRN